MDVIGHDMALCAHAGGILDVLLEEYISMMCAKREVDQMLLYVTPKECIQWASN